MFWKRSGGTSLGEIPAGFRIGRQLFPWGTTPLDAAAALGIRRGDHERGWCHVAAPCAKSYGFATVGMRASAPGLDRPITDVSYELVGPSRDPLPDPAPWTEALMQALGAPAEVVRHGVPPGADPSGAVRYYARWETDAHSVGLSLYGGPRPVTLGIAAGCLWLSWSVLAAATPFLPEWRARADDLARRAAAPTALERFELRTAQQRRTTDASREAHDALNAPDLLPTPSSLGIGPKSFAIWHTGHDQWSASTAWDSVAVRTGAPTPVRWVDILPAKGGGSSSLEIGSWRVRDMASSPAIQAAAKTLEKIAGVRVERVEDYDC